MGPFSLDGKSIPVLVLFNQIDKSVYSRPLPSEKRQFLLRRRRRQRERQNSNRFIKQNNKLARASRFFVHFFAVTARLRRENA